MRVEPTMRQAEARLEALLYVERVFRSLSRHSRDHQNIHTNSGATARLGR
jgi:hypothetical protein